MTEAPKCPTCGSSYDPEQADDGTFYWFPACYCWEQTWEIEDDDERQ